MLDGRQARIINLAPLERTCRLLYCFFQDAITNPRERRDLYITIKIYYIITSYIKNWWQLLSSTLIAKVDYLVFRDMYIFEHFKNKYCECEYITKF